MKIGEYEITEVVHQSFGLDGGAMFGVVPKPLWEKRIPADKKNRIDMVARSLLIEGHGHRILVDTGMGDQWKEKYRKIYKISNKSPAFEGVPQKPARAPEDITDVVLTHLHFDHAGGATIDKGNELVPAFPNARYHVQREQWQWADNPSEKDGGSFREENFRPLEEHGVLNILDGEQELFPALELRVFHGHTPAQQLPLLQGDDTALFFAGDLIPTHAHLSIPWVMGYDNHPLTTIQEKRRILEMATTEQWILVFEHDQKVPAGTVYWNEGRPEIQEIVNLE